MIYAPIVLFVYNRLDHTIRTIEALKNNTLANLSELFIYSDAAKNESDVAKVKQVRSYIRSIQGFKSVTIEENQINIGLAINIKKGIDAILSNYAKVIVLEDDIVTSPFFLEFMNSALEKYENEDRVMQISGYNYPIDTNSLPETFFSTMAACWGWATWSNSWKLYTENIEILEKNILMKGKMKFIVSKRFTYWTQLRLNKVGKLKTWFIFWYASMFINDGLCLYPRATFVKNIGLDGSGTNSHKVSKFDSPVNNQKIIYYENKIEAFDTNNILFKNYFDTTFKSVFLSRTILSIKKIVGSKTFYFTKRVCSNIFSLIFKKTLN